QLDPVIEQKLEGVAALTLDRAADVRISEPFGQFGGEAHPIWIETLRDGPAKSGRGPACRAPAFLLRRAFENGDARLAALCLGGFRIAYGGRQPGGAAADNDDIEGIMLRHDCSSPG